MSELGGFEFAGGQEGLSGAPEALSEEALARLQENAKAIAAIRKEEKQSKRRDTAVAHILVQFLNNKRYSHLFPLIAKLVARNCPSIFILSIIALIHKEAEAEVEKYLQKQFTDSERAEVEQKTTASSQELALNATVLEWLTKVQMVLASDPDGIIRPLLLDEKNIEGSVLQLTSFVLTEHFAAQGKKVAYNKVQPIALQMLHSVLSPYIADIQKRVLAEKAQAARVEDDDDDE